MEAVSPELALVDPDLRAWDLARNRYQSAAPPARTREQLALPQRAERTFTLRLVGLCLLLACAGMVAAWKIAAPNSPTSRAQPTATTRAVADGPATALQRRVLALVMASPASRLPRRLIDRRTGLPSTSLQARCRRQGTGYVCLVRPYPARPGEGLVVRYRAGTFTWDRYRAG